MKKITIFLTVCALVRFSFGGVYEDFEKRLDALRESIPDVTRAAESAAKRIWENPNARLQIPSAECAGFCEELIARAGGLAQVDGRINRGDGVVLFAVRDWESFGARAAYLVRWWKAAGKMVIVFGSNAGKPQDLGEDFFIDNGAEDGSAAHGVVNATANVTLGWMFCCEYAAAFTRAYGKFPAITKSIAPVDSWIYNEANNTPDGSVRFFNCPEKIAQGELAQVYWYRVRKLVLDMREPVVLKSIGNAAEIIADKLEEGRRVGIAGLGHLILEETKLEIKSPMIGFRAVSMLTESLETVLGPGDVFVWLSYSGMNTHWANYIKPMRAAGLELIVSFTQPDIAENTDAYLAYIPQMWALPDAEVSIPVKPGAMAPVSAINRVLLLHQLDDAVFEKWQKRGKSAAKTENVIEKLYDADRFLEYGARFYAHNSLIVDVKDENDRLIVRSEDGNIITESKQFNDLPNPIGPKKPDPGKEGFSHRVKCGNGWIVCKDGLWGYVNNEDEEKIPPKYDMLRRAHDNLLIAEKDRRFGLLDQNGKEILPLTQELLMPIGRGMMTFAKDLRFGIMDSATGKIQTEAVYDLYPHALGERMIKALKDGRYGIFDREGKEVLPPIFEQIGEVRGNEILAEVGGFWKSYSLKAPHDVILPGGEFTEVSYGADGGYNVKKGRLYGELRADFSVRIPPEYDYLSRHAGTGETLLRKNGKWSLMGKDDTIKEFGGDFEWIDFADIGNSRRNKTEIPEPKFRVKKDGKWGFMDSAEKIVIPCIYSSAYGFNDSGVANVAVGGEWRIDRSVRPMLFGGKWGLINREGKLLIPLEYSALWSYGEGRWGCVIREKPLAITP